MLDFDPFFYNRITDRVLPLQNHGPSNCIPIKGLLEEYTKHILWRFLCIDKKKHSTEFCNFSVINMCDITILLRTITETSMTSYIETELAF